MIGSTLAHYKILQKIGSGGMGDVYLAEDTKLDRKVALKVLPPEMAESEQRRARFKREARAIAALDHPNIVQVFSVEEAEGTHFITMQLVQGKTLTELLPKNGFPLNKFFDIAIPLTDAVAAAHQEGITHRDLKPDNMMVGDDGRVKVLDFGLAKPTSGFVGGAAESALPTVAKTAEGVIVGTLNYMSPEQAQGKTVDARSDIFSLGVVLYEMLTARRPFGGDTPAEILSSIIKDTPPSVAEARPEMPRELSKIVQRCLAKDPTRRLQSVLDIRNELEELKADLSSGELQDVAPAARPSVNKWLAALAGVSLVTLAVVLVYSLRASEGTIPRLVNPVQMTSAVGVEDYPTWSLDGGRVAYESDQSGNWDIWVAQVGGGDPVNLTRNNEGDDRFPSWSPDGQQIAFVTEGQTRSLFTMSAVGGRPREIRLPSESSIGDHAIPQWSADGSEIAVAVRRPTGKAVAIVSLESLETRHISIPLHGGFFSADLSWSPDGRTFAYVDSVLQADLTRLWLIPSAGGEPTSVTDGRTKVFSPSWSADGRRLFFVSNRGGAMDLWQHRGKPEGEPESLTTGLGIRRAAFSPDGSKLAYSRGRRVSNVWRVPILSDRVATWSDAAQITFDTAFVERVDVSPDGSRLAISSDRTGNQDLWILPAEGGEMTQLTTDPAPDWAPSWSPDGTEIVFYAYRSGNRDIWVMPSNGGPARQLTTHPKEDVSPSWSSDGREIAFISSRGGARSVWIVDAGGGEPRQLVADGNLAEWSPDGSSIVFVRNRELWRMPVAGGEEERISTGPGRQARWSSDGKLLYYTGWLEHAERLWALSPSDGREYVVADLRGRPGMMGWEFSTDGSYLYFTWWEDLGDIWVMDVVWDE